MPIYEYRCPDCSHEFECIQKMSEDPVSVCPECEQENVRKLLSSPSFHLKGGGWYNDHYGLKSSASGSDKGGDKGGESAGSKDSDSSSAKSSDSSGSSSSASDTGGSSSSASDTGGSSSSSSKD